MRRIAPERRTIELEETHLVTPSVRRMRFRCVDGRAFDFLPGQWVKLFLAEGVSRDYSIASAPVPTTHSDSGRFALLVTRVEGGAGSSKLHSLRWGDRLEMIGPNGLFVREESELAAPAIFVATGTGLAPFLSMLEAELEHPLPALRIVLTGARTEADIVERARIAELRKRDRRLVHTVTLSQAHPEWTGLRGYVQAHLESIVATTPNAHLYICGLRRMVDAVRSLARGPLGFERTHVHSERFD